MATSIAHTFGSIATLLSTEMNALSTNTNTVVGSAYSSSGNYLFAEVEVSLTLASTVAPNFAALLWLLRAPDGTNYEDGSNTITPARCADVLWPMRSGSTTQRMTKRIVLPPGTFIPLFRNECGAALTASGHTVKILPFTYRQT